MRYCRPDENWSRSATFTASSSLTGYLPEYVKNQNPTLGWVAGNGTATLTVDLGASRSVDVIALIMNNGDDDRTITIAGDISTTISAQQGASGYPQNVAYILPATTSAQNLTITITGNSLNWAIGEVVIGQLQTLPSSLLVETPPRFVRKRQVIKDIDDDYEHEIRTDLGSETWTSIGRIYTDDAGLPDFVAWWESTKGGVLPTLIVPDDLTQEVRFVRMQDVLSNERMYDDLNWYDVIFEEVARGIKVV